MWIQTYMGKAFDLLNPDPADIDPHELAVVLSRICRFGGHCKTHYSVAQHSLLVERLVEDPQLKLPALLHDAHEAYIGDIVRPVKLLGVREWEKASERVDGAIAERFGFNVGLFYDPAVKRADDTMLATEARDLMLPHPKPWAPLPPPSKLRVLPLKMTDASYGFEARLNALYKLSK